MRNRTSQNISGQHIQQLRKAKKPLMTQSDLARVLKENGFNIDRVGITKIERGYRQVSDVELVVIAEILGV
ncbi:helix-turn-helix domain-containing protein, partial [Chloroflexota bacterium]